MITKEFYGEYEGRPIDIYTVSKGGMTARISTLGATLVSLAVPDRTGKPTDVVLGYDTLDGFLKSSSYLNVTVGRFANRIRNASFTLGGKEYKLITNLKGHSLHGGQGFHRRVWNAEIRGDKLALTYFSPDGEAGYPGNLETTVLFGITDDRGLRIEYLAVPDRETVCNLTNHAYFNFLEGRRDVLSHELYINADRISLTDETSIPIGEKSVAGTPYDFRTPRKIGESIYDNNYILNGGDGPAATLYEETGGIFMEVFTDRPCMQLYTSVALKNQEGRKGGVYGKGCAVCLETQLEPNCANKEGYTGHIISPEKPFRSVTVYRFSVK